MKFANKNYVANVLDSLLRIIANSRKKLGRASDEVIIADLINCKSLLENMLDSMIFEE